MEELEEVKYQKRGCHIFRGYKGAWKRWTQTSYGIQPWNPNDRRLL